MFSFCVFCFFISCFVFFLFLYLLFYLVAVYLFVVVCLECRKIGLVLDQEGARLPKAMGGAGISDSSSLHRDLDQEAHNQRRTEDTVV